MHMLLVLPGGERRPGRGNINLGQSNMHMLLVLPGGERRPGFSLYTIQKHHARESVFRSERMPASIDRLLVQEVQT